jgi:hypothetical protein
MDLITLSAVDGKSGRAPCCASQEALAKAGHHARVKDHRKHHESCDAGVFRQERPMAGSALCSSAKLR